MRERETKKAPMMVLLSIFEVLGNFYRSFTLVIGFHFSKSDWDSGVKYLYASGWEPAAGIFAKCTSVEHAQAVLDSITCWLVCFLDHDN